MPAGIGPIRVVDFAVQRPGREIDGQAGGFVKALRDLSVRQTNDVVRRGGRSRASREAGRWTDKRRFIAGAIL